jgi:bifunctional non-homologous end joining protein LigD
VKSGRTNDEVRDAPAASWTGSANWAGPTADELSALDDLGHAGRWTLGDHELRLTNLDRVMFPGRAGEPPLTKRDLIRHHATMAPAMLAYLADRPVDVHRFPDGVTGNGSWARAVPSNAPSWLRRWRDEEHREHVVPDSAASLAWLANHGAVELHPWTSTVADPHHPTWALFDIDPGPDDDAARVLELARLHRTALAHLGVEGRPAVTGSHGIQIWVPVAPRATFEQIRAWVDTVSRAIGATLGIDTADAARPIDGRVLAPFSPRAAAGAPVAVPLSWDELDDDDLRPDRWTIRDVGARLASAGDPLAPLIGRQQTLPRL